jgi:hypothetical protein
MIKGLTLRANFIETAKPTMYITNLMAGQQVTNATFTIMGRASDNWQVSNVWCQIDGQGWNLATNLNNGTNWAAGVTLTPGTNVFQVYGVNLGGQFSTTNTLNFQYVVNAPLQIAMSGLGTINPDYSNVVLHLGQNYSLNATPANGFMFTNWIASTNFIGGVTSNNPTLWFKMATNLTLQANFAETAKPTVTVTNLSSGQQVTNATFTVMGKASDNWLVNSVWYQLNGSGWTQASSQNHNTNWTTSISPPLTLTPGTNVFQVYGVNLGGQFSTTNTLNFQYVVNAPLQIAMSGLGTINPDYSNVVLHLGQNYSLNATPANGFMFTNWIASTNFIGGVTSNNPTLWFKMATNLTLQANFAETAKPTVTVTNLSSGQQVTNATFTVMGKASDNWLVNSVWYQLNGSGWTQASSQNHNTNWTTSISPPLTLTPGTNVFQVYGVNLGGQFSTTNTLNFQYVVNAPLQIAMSGLGTINPDYSNVVLHLGQNYSLNATPANGFMFTNWIASTNFIGGVTSNNPTLWFKMATNLTLQANFAETAKPTVTVTNLSSGQQVTNATFTVMGKASDNWLVNSVWYQLNGSGWTQASSQNHNTNWTTSISPPLTLTPGTNVFQVYGVNLGGQFSTTNTLNFQYVVNAPLQIAMSGLGTINPDYSNVVLHLGQNYSLNATPANGFMFTNWIASTNFIGGVTSNNPTLWFKMATNLTLQANFAETAKPTVTISSPSSGTHVAGVLPAIIGTTTDPWRIATVSYSLNNGPWNTATTTNYFKNWWITNSVTLNAGTNTFSVYAMNLGGNYSATNKLILISTNAANSANSTLSLGGNNSSINNAFNMQLSCVPQAPTASGFNFNLNASSTNASGKILVSTDLTNWTVLTNFNTGTNSTISICDPNGTNGQRFYRAVTGP